MEVKEAGAKYLARPRYKRTEVGSIPEDWEEMRFIQAVGSYIDYRGRTPRKLGLSWGGGEILALSANNVQMGRIDPDKEAYFGSEELYRKWMLHGECEIGDVLLTMEAPLGNVAQVPDSRKYILSQRVVLIKPKDWLDRDFLAHYMKGFAFQRQLSLNSTGSTAKGIQRRKLDDLPIGVPPKKAEQEAIAEALSDADALIGSLEKLLTKKRQVKHGAMQQLLTGKKRLPGFSGDWDVTQLGKIGSTFGGLTGKTKRDFGHGTARYITFMNIMTNVVIDCGTFEFVDVKPTEIQNRVAKGDLFFNGSSETPEEVGMCAVLAQEAPGVFLNSFCFGFRFRDDASADGLYLAYFFRSREGRELLKSLAQGATRYNLSKTALLKVEFPLPQLREQSAIAAFLADMDVEIAGLETKLEKARQIKQGMMQELLTGRIRLQV